jgi:hypothetical protein
VASVVISSASGSVFDAGAAPGKLALSIESHRDETVQVVGVMPVELSAETGTDYGCRSADIHGLRQHSDTSQRLCDSRPGATIDTLNASSAHHEVQTRIHGSALIGSCITRTRSPNRIHCASATSVAPGRSRARRPGDRGARTWRTWCWHAGSRGSAIRRCGSLGARRSDIVKGCWPSAW